MLRSCPQLNPGEEGREARGADQPAPLSNRLFHKTCLHDRRRCCVDVTETPATQHGGTRRWPISWGGGGGGEEWECLLWGALVRFQEPCNIMLFTCSPLAPQILLA